MIIQNGLEVHHQVYTLSDGVYLYAAYLSCASLVLLDRIIDELENQ